MSFTDQKPWIATGEDCRRSWGGAKNGKRFRCYLCGHKFVAGDQVRWQYTNDTSGASGNPMVCQSCDGTKEGIVAKWKALHEEADCKLWWFSERE